MSDPTPDTTALRARCEVAAGRTVALNVAHRILLDPSTVRALCDGYDEAQRLRVQVEAHRQDYRDAERLRREADRRTGTVTAERDAARQALTDLIGELRALCDDPKQPGDAVWTDDLRAVIDPYDPDLFQCVHCEQYRDVNDGIDSVAGTACHDCAGRP